MQLLHFVFYVDVYVCQCCQPLLEPSCFPGQICVHCLVSIIGGLLKCTHETHMELLPFGCCFKEQMSRRR